MQVNLKARAAAAEQKRSKTRARLVEAALRMVADKGPDAVSVTDVATAAGLSRGVFYNYFPSLEDLVLAVRERITEDLDQEIMDSIADITDPPERIARAAYRFIERGLRDPIWGWVRLKLDASTPPAPVVQQRFLDLYALAVHQGRFPRGSPMAALSLTVGAVSMAVRVALETGQPPRDLAGQTVAMILTGLGLPRAEAEAITARIPPAVADSTA